MRPSNALPEPRQPERSGGHTAELKKAARRRSIIGDFELNDCFSFAGMSYAYVENSMKLYGSKCIPEFHSWGEAKLRAAG